MLKYRRNRPEVYGLRIKALYNKVSCWIVGLKGLTKGFYHWLFRVFLIILSGFLSQRLLKA